MRVSGTRVVPWSDEKKAVVLEPPVPLTSTTRRRNSIGSWMSERAKAKEKEIPKEKAKMLRLEETPAEKKRSVVGDQPVHLLHSVVYMGVVRDCRTYVVVGG